MAHSYWLKQSSTEPLYPDIEWSKPEQRSHAGKLAIIGGNKVGFAAVATAYRDACDTGAGQVRAILPDVLKPAIPATILDTIYVASNPSGGMARDAVNDVKAALAWADHALLIGDCGRNSETAIILEDILASSTPLTITRDALDLLRPAAQKIADRPSTCIIASLAQVQKLFQAIYYPKMISFSMQLNLLVETLHKFTLTYPVVIVTFHQNQLVAAHDGTVITQPYDDPMRIWRGSTAARAAAYQLWTPSRQFEAVVSSIT